MTKQQVLLLILLTVFNSVLTYVRQDVKQKVIHNRCYDRESNHYFSKGEMVRSNMGNCSARFCQGTVRDRRTGKPVSKFYNQGCNQKASQTGEHCALKPANHSVPYPHCCPRYQCGPQEDGCYLADTDTYYKPGYHVDKNNCVLLNCVQMISRKTRRKSFNLVILRCSPVDVKPLDQNCWIHKGNQKTLYPSCCDELVCSDSGEKISR